MVIHPQTKIIDLGSSKVLSATEIQNLAIRLARGLLKLNLPAGSRVGLVGVNSSDYAIAIVALRMTNLVAVPINYNLTHDKMLHCLRGVKLILCDKEYNSQLPSSIPFFNFNKLDRMMAVGADLPSYESTRVSVVLHTSGSTGDPTPIEFTYDDRHNIVDYEESTVDSVRTLSPNPMFHVAGLNWLEYSLAYGAHIFIVPAYDPKLILESVEKYKISRLVIVSSMFMSLLQKSQVKSTNLDSVTSIILLSAPVNQQAAADIQTYFKNVTYLTNIYGLTETGARVFTPHPTLPTPLSSVGIPIPKYQVKLVDETLHIKSSAILSSAKHSGDEYYNTHDKFRVDSDGFYYYIGRDDDMFKVNGEKVYPSEIELVLEGHPCVAGAVAVGVPDRALGHKPCAFVKLTSEVAVDELVAYTEDRLSTHQVPRTIWILDELPLMSSGKIDRATLTNLGKKYSNEL